MEDTEISLSQQLQELLKTPQASETTQNHFFNSLTKQFELNPSSDTSKPNLHQIPKIPATIDYQIEKIIAHKLDPLKCQNVYLVKFKNKSFHELKWSTDSDFGDQKDIIDEYLKKNPEEPFEPYFNQNYLIPEKVISIKKNKQQNVYLIKWTDLDYTQCTWESEKYIKTLINDSGHNIIKDYEERTKVSQKNTSFLQNPPNFHPILELHTSKIGEQLDSIQIDILNFLMNSWCYSQNSLITGIDGVNAFPGVVNFIESVVNQGKGCFLIITDQLLIEKWETEISEWTNVSFLTFTGTKENLEIIKKYEFSKPGISNDDFIYPIYITTVENLTSYYRLFSQITWECVILDNSLKDKIIFTKSTLNPIVSKIKMKYRVFLTPPLEKVDPHDIWPWLNFIDPNFFHLESRFNKTFCKEGKIEVDKLNSSSFTHFDNLNNKNFDLVEKIVKCPLTEIQEESIRSIYGPLLNDSNIDQDFTKSGINFRQIIQSTKKVLNHPFSLKAIANKALQERKKTYSTNDYLIYESEVCGKLFVLGLLLKKLKSESKNVVIICQSSESIEVLEKYMLAKSYCYEKVDLFRRGRSRYEAVMQFNDESKRIFAFILDSKTGYIAMKADYVVIYESDMNPRNDIFIGNKILSSKKKKEVYRLVTEKTFEMTYAYDYKHEQTRRLELAKLVMNGKNELLSEKSIEENDALIQYINSEDSEIDSLFQNHTLEKKYSSIKEMSESLPFDQWKQFSELKVDNGSNSIEKVDSENKNLTQLDENSKLSENESYDDGNENETSFEEEEFNEEEFDENEKKADSSGWTPKLIFSLFNLMLKYGITSWEMFTKSIPISADKISKVGMILIFKLLEKTDNKENYIILQKYLDQNKTSNYFLLPELKSTDSFSHKAKVEEDDFATKHSKEIQKITSPRVDWKLDRLEFLYIVDISFIARERSNGERAIPCLRLSTIENDTKIMEIVKKKGYPITKLPTLLKNAKMTLKRINSRALTLGEELKTIFLDYCQIFELDERLTPEKLLDSLKMLNKKDRKKVFQTLQTVGIDNLETVFEALKLKKDKKKVFMRYMDQFYKFAYIVIKNKKVPFDFFGAHYSLKTLTEAFLNIAMLKYLREVVDLKNIPEKDLPIFEYVKLNGFKNVKKESIFTERFKEPIEQSLADYLHSYFLNKKKLILANFFKGYESATNSPSKHDAMIKPEISFKRELTQYNGIEKVGGDQKSFEFSNNDETNSKLNVLSKYIDFNIPEGSVLSEEEINSILPLKINDNTIITNFGKVVTDRPSFHSERYLYLDGFTSERFYTSVRDPNTKEWYICSIKDTGGDTPLFTIELKDDPSISFKGSVSSKPSIELLKKIDSARNKSKYTSRSPTISGPEFFAFASPKMRKIMTKLPGADKCPKFKGLSIGLPNNADGSSLKQAKNDVLQPRKGRPRGSKVVFVDEETSYSEYYSNREEDETEDDDDETEDDEDEEEISEEEEITTTTKRRRATATTPRKRKNATTVIDDDDDDRESDSNDDVDEIEYDDDHEEFKVRPKIGSRGGRGYSRGRGRGRRKLSISTRSSSSPTQNLTKRGRRRGRNIIVDDDDDESEYGENEASEEEEEDEDEDDNRSLVQRVKNYHLKGRPTKSRFIKRYNLRKRVNRTNYKEYEEEEYQDYYDEANEEEDEDEYGESASNNENTNNDDDDDEITSHSIIEKDRKISPNKSLSKSDSGRLKDKKSKTSLSDLSDSSDQENYYNFACNIIPDIFPEEKKSSNKNNVLKSGVVFYFDKLSMKTESDFIENYFGNDPDMLILDKEFLNEFILENPRSSHYFSNK